MELVAQARPALGVAPACLALSVPRASFYRWGQPKVATRRPASHRALGEQERAAVVEVLHEPRFVDLPPAQVHATLLDEGRYLCSERTMYRILTASGESRERRDQLVHPAYAAPRLLATAPNQVWSWDITKLLGPAKWTFYYLYVILDIFSRYVVGWMVAHRESASLAQRLIAATCWRQGIEPGQLTVHADRGSSMTSKPVTFLLADLGVTKTHSRPHVSNDNPYSEANFKTLKYRPDFPAQFGSVQHARAHCGDFFPWYNEEHHHSALGMLTPHEVHYGLAEAKLAARAAILASAFAAHPERFPHGLPKPPELPKAVWINRPPEKEVEAAILAAAAVGRQIDAPGSRRNSDLWVPRGRGIPDTEPDELAEVIH